MLTRTERKRLHRQLYQPPIEEWLMSESQEALVLVGLFALRCIAPLLLTMAIGYLMNRLADRWEAEDARRQLPEAYTGTPAGEDNQLESVRLRPCWLFKKCDPEKRKNCPAYQRPGLPCWLAHLRANGNLTTECPDCPIYISAWATD